MIVIITINDGITSLSVTMHGMTYLHIFIQMGKILKANCTQDNKLVWFAENHTQR